MALTEKEAKRVIQESRKSNQEIIKKALSKFVKLNNTTNTRPPATTSTNTRKTQQVVRTPPPKKERHWLGVILELV